MKNIQIIDGATNIIFEIYAVSDKLFRIMFPEDSDIAFLDEVEKTFTKRGRDRFWRLVYKNRVNKKAVRGIHGTLHLTLSSAGKKDFPTRREKDVT